MLKTMDEQWVIQQLCVCPTDHMERRNGLMSGKKCYMEKWLLFWSLACTGAVIDELGVGVGTPVGGMGRGPGDSRWHCLL